MPTFPMPGVVTTTASAPFTSAFGQSGLTTALVGSFPFGPAFDPLNPSNCLAYNQAAALSRWGNDITYNDKGGYSGPPSARVYFEQGVAGRNTPVALIIRAGLTQASVSIATLSTISALPAMGGADANGTTVVIAAPVSGNQTITVTPPTNNPEGITADPVYTVASGATWATVAAAINGQSKSVVLTINSADTGTAIPATLTTYTLGSGTTGANATATQINAAVDLLSNLQYNSLPVNAIVPLFSDTATSGVALHALTDAIANIGNGQRMRVFASCSTSFGQGSSAVSGIVTLAGTLLPSENSGDSGRCMLLANNYPYRTDPATNGSGNALPRLYPGYVFAAGVAGMDAALNPQSTPRGRRTIYGFTSCAEGYATTDWTTLLKGGANVAYPWCQLIDERTTSISTTYRALAAVQACEDLMAADLANVYNTREIETATTVEGLQEIQTITGFRLSSYQQAGLCQSASAAIAPNPSDPTQELSTVTWNPILGIRGVGLTFNLYVPPPTGAVTVSTQS